MLSYVDALAFLDACASGVDDGTVVDDYIIWMVDQNTINARIQQSKIFQNDILTVFYVDSKVIQSYRTWEIDVSQIFEDDVGSEVDLDPRGKPNEDMWSQRIDKFCLRSDCELLIDAEWHICSVALKIVRLSLGEASQKGHYNKISI